MDKRLVCTIDSWPVDSQYPLGHYVRALGQIGDKDTETEVRQGLAALHANSCCMWKQQAPQHVLC